MPKTSVVNGWQPGEPDERPVVRLVRRRKHAEVFHSMRIVGIYRDDGPKLALISNNQVSL